MKIQIEGAGHNMTIPLPTRLIFSKTAVKMCIHMGKKHAAKDGGTDALLYIPDDALVTLCAEIRRIKEKYGSWELMEAESADGECVKITL